MPTEVLLPEVCLRNKLIVASQVAENTALIVSLLKLVTKPYKFVGPTRVSLQCLKVVLTAHSEITDIWTTLKVLVNENIVVHAMLFCLRPPSHSFTEVLQIAADTAT